MTTMHREREDIYDLDVDVTLPELASVSPAVSGVAEEDTIHLTSLYYDTADLDLLRNGITLRRRNGTVDAGWQLKMPDGDSRIEIALPPSDGGVPKELRDLVLGARRGQPLQRVATVEISRDVQRHLAADGRVLAVVSDDTVHASSASKPSVLSGWREVQVELGDVGDEALLAAIGTRLIRAGAEPALIRSKVARALATSLSAAGHAPSRDRWSAGSVATGYLRRQYAALIAGDAAPQTRAGRVPGDPDPGTAAAQHASSFRGPVRGAPRRGPGDRAHLAVDSAHRGPRARRARAAIDCRGCCPAR